MLRYMSRWWFLLLVTGNSGNIFYLSASLSVDYLKKKLLRPGPAGNGDIMSCQYVASYQFMLALLLWCLDMIIKIIEAEFISKSFENCIVKKLRLETEDTTGSHRSRNLVLIHWILSRFTPSSPSCLFSGHAVQRIKSSSRAFQLISICNLKTPKNV